MRAISTSSVSWDEVLACLSALRNVTLPKFFQKNVLLTSYTPSKVYVFPSVDVVFPSVDVHSLVYGSSSTRRSTPSYSFTTAVRQLYHRPVVTLPDGSGRATARQWQSFHRPVNDGKVLIEKREDLDSSLIMKKFVALRSPLTHTPIRKGKILSTQRT